LDKPRRFAALRAAFGSAFAPRAYPIPPAAQAGMGIARGAEGTGWG
jgi:hypothetical protein